jgi:hypothetical protein
MERFAPSLQSWVSPAPESRGLPLTPSAASALPAANRLSLMGLCCVLIKITAGGRVFSTFTLVVNHQLIPLQYITLYDKIYPNLVQAGYPLALFLWNLGGRRIA